MFALLSYKDVLPGFITHVGLVIDIIYSARYSKAII